MRSGLAALPVVVPVAAAPVHARAQLVVRLRGAHVLHSKVQQGDHATATPVCRCLDSPECMSSVPFPPQPTCCCSPRHTVFARSPQPQFQRAHVIHHLRPGSHQLRGRRYAHSTAQLSSNVQ